jgi:hypothetical protein
MANVSGVRTTANILAARLPVDMADKIAILDASKNPFLTFLKNIKKDARVVYNPKFNWLEDALLGNYTLKNGANASTSNTSMVVDDGSIFRNYDIVKNMTTGEVMLVTGVTSNTLTVVRGYGSSSAVNVGDDDEFLIIGNAQEENADGRAVKSTQEADCYNYTQIFRTPISLSGTEAASKLYGGKDRGYQRMKAGIEHARDIAYSMYFGEKKLDTENTNTVRRTMGGVVEFLTTASQTQAFAANGTHLNYANFDSLVAQKAFTYGSSEKLLICGPKLAAMVNSWAMSDLITNVKEETYGMNVKKLMTSYGVMNVVYDPILATNTVSAGYGFVIDLDKVRYAYLDGRDTKLRTEIQDADVDGLVDEYLTECSLELKNGKCHMLLTGCYNPGTTES